MSQNLNLNKYKDEKISQATGRRKAAIAQVTIFPGLGSFYINGKSAGLYMNENPISMAALQAPYDLLGFQKKFETHVKVYGGGLVAQAKAIELGIARALAQMSSSSLSGLPQPKVATHETQDSYRSLLKQRGFLTRDARCKERRKYGLKKARKAPQYSKR